MEKKFSCETEFFGKAPGGGNVKLYRISGGGITAEILSYGAIIHKLLAPDRDGVPADVALGQDDIAGYQKKYNCAGAVIGRVANRISGARFVLNGKEHRLEANYGGDVLHGSSGNYAEMNFSGEGFSDENGAGVKLTHTDTGAGGFPGVVSVTVTYSVDAFGGFRIYYTALPEEDTPINLTNHIYFNLAGHDAGYIGAHILQLDAGFITPNDARGMTTGEIRPVRGTDFDFSSPRPLEAGINSEDILYKQFGGFDMNFCLSGRGMRKGGSITDPISGRSMEFYTDAPGVQIFTMPCFPVEVTGKGGVTYVPNGAVCVETQNFPDCVNITHFPDPVVKAGETYATETVFKFGTV